MILSVSRRTDIPAFFSDWFINRVKEGYALVRNPMNIHQVSRINISPDIVDCIVFWSKNPKPLIHKFDLLNEYMFYFQYTLNAYDEDIEMFLPDLDNRIATFQTIANLLGKDRIIWRYDPILVNEKYSVEWHQEQFQYIANKLKGYTNKVTISFIDLYSRISVNLKQKSILPPTSVQIDMLSTSLSQTANNCGMCIDTCAEEIDLSKYKIAHAKCIDNVLIEKLLGCSLDVDKDKNQRQVCGCVASIDLGLYNTCQNGCIYCYANHNKQQRTNSINLYDPNSPLLCSQLSELDKLSERLVKSYKKLLSSIFENVLK